MLVVDCIIVNMSCYKHDCSFKERPFECVRPPQSIIFFYIQRPLNWQLNLNEKIRPVRICAEALKYCFVTISKTVEQYCD